MNYWLFIYFIFELVLDFFRFPLQLFFNQFILRKKIYNPEKMIFNKNSFEDVLIIIHHYAKTGTKFVKATRSGNHRVGVEYILNQVLNNNLNCICFVEDSSINYFNDLNKGFPSITFVNSHEKKFDFPSYLQAKKYSSNKIRYYCMLNDNFDKNSNIISFISSGLNLVVNHNIGLVGVGSNSYVTQSLFKFGFKPHVQTYAYLCESRTFDSFSKKFDWFLKSYNNNFYFKQMVCRILEQGLSDFYLKSGKGIAFIQGNNLIKYFRRNKFLDFKKDWTGISGDYRHNNDSPFVVSGLNGNSNE